MSVLRPSPRRRTAKPDARPRCAACGHFIAVHGKHGRCRYCRNPYDPCFATPGEGRER